MGFLYSFEFTYKYSIADETRRLDTKNDEALKP